MDETDTGQAVERSRRTNVRATRKARRFVRFSPSNTNGAANTEGYPTAVRSLHDGGDRTSSPSVRLFYKHEPIAIERKRVHIPDESKTYRVNAMAVFFDNVYTSRRHSATTTGRVFPYTLIDHFSRPIPFPKGGGVSTKRNQHRRSTYVSLLDSGGICGNYGAKNETEIL